MPRPKGKYARITTQPYRPTNRKFNKNTDRRWTVVYPHPTKLGKVKTESFKSVTQAIDRRDTLNHIYETSKKTLRTEKWTVNDALTFWIEKKASTLVSSVKEVPRAEYIGAVIGDIRLSDLDEEHYEKLYLHIKHDDTRSITTNRGIDAYFVTLRTAL